MTNQTATFSREGFSQLKQLRTKMFHSKPCTCFIYIFCTVTFPLNAYVDVYVIRTVDLTCWDMIRVKHPSLHILYIHLILFRSQGADACLQMVTQSWYLTKLQLLATSWQTAFVKESLNISERIFLLSNKITCMSQNNFTRCAHENRHAKCGCADF